MRRWKLFIGSIGNLLRRRRRRRGWLRLLMLLFLLLLLEWLTSRLEEMLDRKENLEKASCLKSNHAMLFAFYTQKPTYPLPSLHANNVTANPRPPKTLTPSHLTVVWAIVILPAILTTRLRAPPAVEERVPPRRTQFARAPTTNVAKPYTPRRAFLALQFPALIAAERSFISPRATDANPPKLITA
jgi:hypothetical protein